MGASLSVRVVGVDSWRRSRGGLEAGRSQEKKQWQRRQLGVGTGLGKWGAVELEQNRLFFAVTFFFLLLLLCWPVITAVIFFH